jgi:hypothetical protein
MLRRPQEIGMSEAREGTEQGMEHGGVFGFLWKRKSWWLLPLVVLVLLLGAIYVLVHLSASDPETYPTSSRSESHYSRLC